MRRMHQLPAAMLLLLLPGCTGVADTLLRKEIAAEVKDAAREKSCWYSYLPHRSPNFCLRTRHAIVWKDDSLNLGYWQGLHPQAPHRVLMEARGNTLILHRRYVWDGNSVGATTPADLLPSLRHDALYHALKEGAPLSRSAIDRAYRADCKRSGADISSARYGILRMFGGIFNDMGQHYTMLIRPTTPQTPPAPLEKDRFDDPFDELANTPPPGA